MTHSFDYREAEQNLANKEKERQASFEKERIVVLNRTVNVLKEYFQGKDVGVFLVGSITNPGKFTRESDVDIVLKNFHGDRFDVWTELARRIERDVEVILFENCSFQDHVEKFGLKVL